VDGVVIQLTEPPTLKKQEKHTVEVVIDRLAVKASAKRRLNDSVETALRLAGGMITLDFVDLPEDDPQRERMYSEHLYCPYDDLSFEELEPRSFSFNSPFGACPECTGLGIRMEVDEELIIPDPDLSLNEGAIAPWSGSGQANDYFGHLLEGWPRSSGFDHGHPVAQAPGQGPQGDPAGPQPQGDGQLHQPLRPHRSYSTGFEGVIPWVERRHAEAESDSSREKHAGYMREAPCPACHGTRLKPLVLAVTWAGRPRAIAEVAVHAEVAATAGRRVR
jgi:excinuclease ABC subunit A